MTDDLMSRLGDEDGFVERKTEAAANAQEIRKTLVAFANSVPQGKTAVFYIGVDNDGAVVGVTNNGWRWCKRDDRARCWLV